MKKVPLFFIIIGVLGVFMFFFKKDRLAQHGVMKEGTIVELRNKKRTRLYVRFNINGEEPLPLSETWRMKVSGNLCRSALRNNIEELKKYTFPVIQDPKMNNNAEILLFKKQYEKYEVEIPEELKLIVAKLSDCQ